MNARSCLALLLLAAGCTRAIPHDVAAFILKVRRTPLAQDRHDPRALQFYEEAEWLADRYAAVARWPSLEATRGDLARYLNAHPPELFRWEDKLDELRRSSATAARGGRFGEAERKLTEFGVRFGEENDSRLALALAEERRLLARRAVVWAERRCAEAFHERCMGRNFLARQVLLNASDDVAGFPPARGMIAKALAEIPD
jgi:hypothetical protein